MNKQKQLSSTLNHLKEANLDSIRVLSEAIEAKDPYTGGHCHRVSRIAQAMAKFAGYDEKMLSTITNTNIDIVRSAVKIFTQLSLMEFADDKTIYMNEVNKMIGSETNWAEKKRLYREKHICGHRRTQKNLLDFRCIRWRSCQSRCNHESPPFLSASISLVSSLHRS